jgi:hypothetical protein
VSLPLVEASAPAAQSLPAHMTVSHDRVLAPVVFPTTYIVGTSTVPPEGEHASAWRALPDRHSDEKESLHSNADQPTADSHRAGQLESSLVGGGA